MLDNLIIEAYSIGVENSIWGKEENIMKKFISIALAFLLLFALLPAVASAEPEASGTCGENLNWTLENGVLTISGTGAMADYGQNGETAAPWVSYRGDIESVVIGNNVTRIGNCAFFRCENLTGDIMIPDSVISIGESAFQWSHITSITIPHSVTSIGHAAIAYIPTITSITIPNSLTSTGTSVCQGCSNLQSVTIENGVTSIGNSAFLYCPSLESITIPNSVTSIGSSAFQGGTSLESITIPNSVTSIGECAFTGTGLRNITIPNSVTSIGSSAFQGCTSLESITISNSVTSISGNMVSGCPLLTSITIPNSVTSIGNNAFQGTGLESITIPNGVTTIDQNAFRSCTNLTSITIPDGVTSIASNAFLYCNNLSNVTIVETGSGDIDAVRSLVSQVLPNATITVQELPTGPDAYVYTMGGEFGNTMSLDVYVMVANGVTPTFGLVRCADGYACEQVSGSAFDASKVCVFKVATTNAFTADGYTCYLLTIKIFAKHANKDMALSVSSGETALNIQGYGAASPGESATVNLVTYLQLLAQYDVSYTALHDAVAAYAAALN